MMLRIFLSDNAPDDRWIAVDRLTLLNGDGDRLSIEQNDAPRRAEGQILLSQSFPSLAEHHLAHMFQTLILGFAGECPVFDHA